LMLYIYFVYLVLKMTSKLPDVLTEQEIAQIVKNVKIIRIQINQIMFRLEGITQSKFLEEHNKMWEEAHLTMKK